ncbi:hypothetical protein Bca4012_056338 [Brassica carinata]|uniref:Uncharacterized protein n=1 Tax=Brassica carinata TaxID=52824 RepID=A0A8X7PE94_BRACI|nr:hypothetical protein Bca52824_088851 [Brassica carinata]
MSPKGNSKTCQASTLQHYHKQRTPPMALGYATAPVDPPRCCRPLRLQGPATTSPNAHSENQSKVSLNAKIRTGGTIHIQTN